MWLSGYNLEIGLEKMFMRNVSIKYDMLRHGYNKYKKYNTKNKMKFIYRIGRIFKCR